MRSRRFLACCLALLPLGSCDSEAGRLEDVCRKLLRCTQYETAGLCDGESVLVDEDACEQELDDALRDRRLTATGLTRCAQCMTPPGGTRKQTCADILNERHCDVACAELSVVLGARTCAETRDCHLSRRETCAVLERRCGFVATECTCDVQQDYALGTLQAQVDVDREAAACVACVLSQQGTGGTGATSGAGGTSNQAGMGGMSGEAGAPPRAEEGMNLAACTALADACGEACVDLEPVAVRLRDAAAAATYCERYRGCLATSLDQPPAIGADSASAGGQAPGAGGLGGAGMTAGVGGIGADSAGYRSVLEVPTDECFRKLIARDNQALVACAQCAKDLDCGPMLASCKCEEVKL